MGVLTKIDGNALGRSCRFWSRWRKAEAFIDQHGLVYPIKDHRGQVKCVQQWPQVAVAHKLSKELTRLEAEFGMTPSARTRIHVVIQPVQTDSLKESYFRPSRVESRPRNGRILSVEDFRSVDPDAR